jgi:hypothetical protein
MADDVNDFLASGGIPGAKFDAIGDKVKGVVVASQVVAQKDFETGAVERWEDGTEKKQVIVDLQTEVRDSKIDSDDGMRRLYCKANLLTALRTALRAAGAPLENGGELEVEYTADGTPPKKGFSAPKLYKAVYTPPTAKPITADDLA